MKRKKILSILLASAMIGTAPASAWAADFTDNCIEVFTTILTTIDRENIRR